MERKAFGKLADGEEATLYTISNTKGCMHRLQILEHPLYHLW